jgi:hypothetical protein
MPNNRIDRVTGAARERRQPAEEPSSRLRRRPDQFVIGAKGVKRTLQSGGMRNGGPLETGLDRTLIGGAILLLAPLLLVAAPVPAIAGAIVVEVGTAFMLRAPASDEHQHLLQLLAADIAVYVMLGVAALLVPIGAAAGALTVLATAAGAAAFVINGYAMRELCRGLGHGGLGRRWRNANVAIARAGGACTIAIGAAFATDAISVDGHRYVVDTHAPASIAYAATVVVFVAMVVRLSTLVSHTRYTVRVHFENEPLRRLRRPQLRQLPGQHPGN